MTVPDFAAGGYRFKDLVEQRIVSSRGDLHYKQKHLDFPRPVKIGPAAAWFAKSEVHAWLAQRAALRGRSEPQRKLAKNAEIAENTG